MDRVCLETDRLTLRHFEERDLDALHLLLKDEEVNAFLPWFPAETPDETKRFFENRLKDRPYAFAICLMGNDSPVGYIDVETGGSHELGYALRREFWHRGIVTEAGRAVVERLKEDGVPYIIATHDINNPRSGGVMRNIGMKYCYSYKEQWQPKNFPVVFRMYQLNLDGQEDRVDKKLWDKYQEHFVEEGLRASSSRKGQL
ncbi:MAG: GNAT family N-acetyltransferase [Clostridia bacterium]|nr:GNAT family N-acetyltransferase [Clostridia bacterium]